MYSNLLATRLRLNDRLKGLFHFTRPNDSVVIDEYYKNKYQDEATLGGGLIGSKANTASCEFFCMDESNWLQHEEWVGYDGQKHSRTIRYEIKKDCIYKYLGDGRSYILGPKEATDLLVMVKRYRKAVCNYYYSNNKN